MYVMIAPITSEPGPAGTLAILRTRVTLTRRAALWRRALTGVAIQTILIVCVTLLILRWSLRRPLARLAIWLTICGPVLFRRS